MKVLYFDCFSGISGDMTLGSLLDLGINEADFLNEMQKLKLDGYKIIINKVTKNGIVGTDVKVVLEDGSDADSHYVNQDQHSEHKHHGEYKSYEEHAHVEHDHHEEHIHGDHDHGDHCHHAEHTHEYNEHHDDHCHHGEHAHGDREHHSEHEYHVEHNHGKHDHHEQHEEHVHVHGGRNLIDIEKIIDESDIKPDVKAFSKKVFREIAGAEAKVHNKHINEVHFHEVGAIDSIVDIVGVSVCLDLLEIEKVYSSPLHDGHGFIKCQHGTIPVPVPAVMEMLAGSNIPLVSVDVNTELVTPTGMGIIKCLSCGFGIMPPMAVLKVGYGMGKRDTGGFNALRVVVGSLEEKPEANDEIIILETNIDNMNPEILGYTMERLLENGALDVFHTPIYMKKNRPAVMLSVLTNKENEEKLVDILLKETSTLGIRRTASKRYCLNRRFETVETTWGKVNIKVASMGEFEKASPEYEDCARIAKEAGIPLNRVIEAAKLEYYQKG